MIALNDTTDYQLLPVQPTAGIAIADEASFLANDIYYVVELLFQAGGSWQVRRWCKASFDVFVTLPAPAADAGREYLLMLHGMQQHGYAMEERRITAWSPAREMPSGHVGPTKLLTTVPRPLHRRVRGGLW